MAGTSSRNFKVKKCVVKVVEEDNAFKEYHEVLEKVCDKDSLEHYGDKLYKTVEKFGVFQLAKVLDKVQPEPPRFLNLRIGKHEVGSYNFSGNPSTDDLQDRAMGAFKDATKYCEHMEMKKQFDVIRDYSSLHKYVCRFFESMLKSGVIDDLEEIRQKIVLSVVVVHTFVIGVWVTARSTNAALKAFQYMSASGIAPISYSYAVLIKGLTADPNYCRDAKKFLLEMMDKGMRPNAVTYTAVIEGFAKLADKAAEEEGKQLVEVMMHKGFVPNAKAMMEVLKGRPTPLVRRVINIALSKLKS